MNNRHRRVERLRREYESPADRKALQIINAMMKVGLTMGRLAKVVKKNQQVLNEVAEKLKEKKAEMAE